VVQRSSDAQKVDLGPHIERISANASRDQLDEDTNRPLAVMA